MTMYISKQLVHSENGHKVSFFKKYYMCNHRKIPYLYEADIAKCRWSLCCITHFWCETAYAKSALYAIATPVRLSVCPSDGWISQNGWSEDHATFTTE